MKGALAAAGLLALTGCGGIETPAPTPTPTPDALTQMMVAFEDMPSRLEIKAVLDPAMDATGMPITEENYGRAGSALVALRKRNGTPEMGMLRCMPSRRADPRIAQRGWEVDFATVAAVCSVDILEGRFRG